MGKTTDQKLVQTPTDQPSVIYRDSQMTGRGLLLLKIDSSDRNAHQLFG